MMFIIRFSIVGCVILLLAVAGGGDDDLTTAQRQFELHNYKTALQAPSKGGFCGPSVC